MFWPKINITGLSCKIVLLAPWILCTIKKKISRVFNDWVLSHSMLNSIICSVFKVWSRSQTKAFLITAIWLAFQEVLYLGDANRICQKRRCQTENQKKKKKSLGIFWSQIEDNDLLSARKYFFFFFFGIRWSSEFIRNALKIPYAMEIMPALWEAALLILMNYFCPSFITFNIFKFKKCKRRKKKKKRRKRSSYGQLRECSKQETVHDRLL